MNEEKIICRLNSFCKNNVFLASITVSVCFKTDKSTGVYVNDYGNLYVNWNNDEMQFKTDEAIVAALAHEVMHCYEIEEKMYEYSIPEQSCELSGEASEFFIFQTLVSCYKKKQYDNYLMMFCSIGYDFLCDSFLEGLAFYTEEEFKRIDNPQYSQDAILTYYINEFAKGKELRLCKYLCGYMVLIILDDIFPEWKEVMLKTRCNPFGILYDYIVLNQTKNNY